MRSLAVLAICAACGGHAAAPHTAAPAASAFAAARWIPAHPTYVFAAPTLREAQHALSDAADALAPALGGSASDLSHALVALLAVDPLDEDAVAAIGVDPGGGVAMFSQQIDPTFVVHLAAPDALAAFFDRQREHGLVTHSVIVDGDEVFTTRLRGDIDLSWVVDHDWLWVHFAIADDHASTAWFAQAHHPAPADWSSAWAWAEQLAARARGVRGFVALHGLVTDLAKRAPEALACVRLVQPIERVGVTIAASDHGVALDLGFALGPAAQGLRAALLAPPPGWARAAAGAPISLAWNLDAAAVGRWLAPCTDILQRAVGEEGVRAARVLVQHFDPDDQRHTRAALSFDLASDQLARGLLEKIPMRSQLERDHVFGPYHGHRIAVPFGPTADYVLDEHVALVAIGDGLLDAVVAPPPGTPAAPVPPILALDVVPGGLPASAWEWLFSQAGLDDPHAAAEHLLRWSDLHAGVRLDGDVLVIEAAGNRRGNPVTP